MTMEDDLGMKRAISRRDFLQASAASLTIPAFGATTGSSQPDYPPGKTGLRGSHEGSFETAHALAREGRSDWPDPIDGESYDLIIVGGGISGLAAAYFYRRENPEARILILDNHDDFGGHAKRNEFTVAGRHLIGYGGSQSLEAPSDYSEVARGLLDELGVDLDGFYQAFDQDFYARHGLTANVFFDESNWGRDVMVPSSFLIRSGLLRIDGGEASPEDLIRRMPLTDPERAELTRLVTVSEDLIPQVGLPDIGSYLSSISYERFLRENAGVESERLLSLFRRMPAGYFGVGTDALPALYALMFGLPGLNKVGIPGAEWLAGMVMGAMGEPYIHHFPDGNAAIARGLVRSLIPEVTPMSAMNDLVVAQFDYGQLDREEHNVRIRLNSTVIRAENRDSGVAIRYVRGGRTHDVKAKQAVLACYNMMIPHLCPELPLNQREALQSLVKIPLVYTNVALTNWRAVKEAGLGFAFTPGSFHDYCMVDFPVSLGGYRFPEHTDEPMLMHFSATVGAPGLPPRDQHRAGRARLLATSFEDIEKDLRRTLAGMLGNHGFDPAAEIAAITVNRWPHGYAYDYNPLFDPDYAPGEAPHEIGRKRFGNIAIANSDAGARAYLDGAVDQAHRAVSELLG